MGIFPVCLQRIKIRVQRRMMVLSFIKTGLFVPPECVDIAELLPTLSEKFSDTSNESSLSPEEVVVDAPQLSDRQNSNSYSKTENSSRPEDDSQKESLKSVSKIGPEVDRDTPPTTENEERTTAGDMIMGAGEDLEDSGDTRPNDSPLPNFFLRIFDLIGKVSEITDHIGKLA
ncbi:unnamed protein product [Taenia asiatica]|uniref:Ovule protein n=1 Tax=Taenia asiatica TaxID=60517 RepID=A0A0R3W6J9_TAEAS|nr:unnamed protein product [Taenia asiatica]